MYVVQSQPRKQRRPTRAYETRTSTFVSVFDSLNCSKESLERLRRLAASGAAGPAIAIAAPADLAPLAAGELARGLVPADARALDIHQAAPEGDRWSLEEVRTLIHGPAYLVAVTRCVVIVHGAHLMDQSCTDSMLKLMEEPPNNTLFLLCVPAPEELSVTLRSRLASSVVVEPAPVTKQLGALVEAGLSREDARDVLTWAQDSHAVAAAVVADISILPLVRDALGASLTGAAPALRAKSTVAALEELTGVLLANEGAKTSDVARRARTRVLCRSLISRWRSELAAAVRTDNSDIRAIAAATTALDELDAALWRYRPTLAAVTAAFTAASALSMA
jgi:hypothetical protein